MLDSANWKSSQWCLELCPAECAIKAGPRPTSWNNQTSTEFELPKQYTSKYTIHFTTSPGLQANSIKANMTAAEATSAPAKKPAHTVEAATQASATSAMQDQTKTNSNGNGSTNTQTVPDISTYTARTNDNVKRYLRDEKDPLNPFNLRSGNQ